MELEESGFVFRGVYLVRATQALTTSTFHIYKAIEVRAQHISQYTLQGLAQNLPSDEVDVWRLCGAEDPDSTSPLEVVVNWSSGGCSITSSNRGSEWRDGVDWLSLHSCDGRCDQGREGR